MRGVLYSGAYTPSLRMTAPIIRACGSIPPKRGLDGAPAFSAHRPAASPSNPHPCFALVPACGWVVFALKWEAVVPCRSTAAAQQGARPARVSRSRLAGPLEHAVHGVPRMKQSSTPNPFVTSIFLPSARLALNVSLGLAAAALVAAPGIVRAQDAAPAAAAAGATQSDAQAAPDSAQPAGAQGSMAISNEKQGKQPRAAKPRKQDEKVVQSKDSKKADKKNAKTISLTGKDTKLPDKALYDKAQDAIKHGRYDVGRIDLQTLLNTYPESQYMMQSKLAIADSWYKEGGTAALTQAEQEYKDFITFFPNAPEAAEAQMRVGDI